MGDCRKYPSQPCLASRFCPPLPLEILNVMYTHAAGFQNGLSLHSQPAEFHNRLLNAWLPSLFKNFHLRVNSFEIPLLMTFFLLLQKTLLITLTRNSTAVASLELFEEVRLFWSPSFLLHEHGNTWLINLYPAPQWDKYFKIKLSLNTLETRFENSSCLQNFSPKSLLSEVQDANILLSGYVETRLV